MASEMPTATGEFGDRPAFEFPSETAPAGLFRGIMSAPALWSPFRRSMVTALVACRRPVSVVATPWCS